MNDVIGMLQQLRRPRLLIRAARFGAQDYVRDRHLRRILGYGALPRPAAALIQLMEIERVLDDQRRAGDAGYSLTRHLDLLIAMMAESRLVGTTDPQLASVT